MLRVLVVCVLVLPAALASTDAAVGGGVRGAPTGELVFARGGDLYVMAVDASTARRLTATNAGEHDPAPSPDGTLIAYTRGADELWLMNSDGTGQTMILAARPASVRYADTGRASWAPNGRALFVDRSAQGPNEICGWIYRVTRDGGGLQRLTHGVELDFDAAVAPTGELVAFSRGGCEPSAGPVDLVVVDLAGRLTNDLQKLPHALGDEFDPAWAPNGRLLAFSTTNQETGTTAVYVANSDGSSVRRVTPENLGAESPAWSPDGQWIAFASSTTSDLFLVRPDGTGLRRLTRTKGRESNPSWLPN